MTDEHGRKSVKTKPKNPKNGRSKHPPLRSEQDFARAIIKNLDKLTALGLRNGDIFIDFLTLCEYEARAIHHYVLSQWATIWYA